MLTACSLVISSFITVGEIHSESIFYLRIVALVEFASLLFPFF